MKLVFKTMLTVLVFSVVSILSLSSVLAAPPNHHGLILLPSGITLTNNNVTTQFYVTDPDVGDLHFYVNATLNGTNQNTILLYNNSNYLNNSDVTNYTVLPNGVFTFQLGISDNDGKSYLNSTTFNIDGADSFQYYCVSGTSVQLDDMTNGSLISTSKSCQYGCSNTTGLSYHQGANPQADLCNPDPWQVDLWIIGGTIAFILVMFFLFWMVQQI